jgi:RNA polymerase sigma-70 factor (sigma-E family)
MPPANRISRELQPSCPALRLGGVLVTNQAEPTGAAMTERDADFTAYLQARQARLLRTAYVLTGDRHQAEDLLQTSLAKLYLAWNRVQDRESVDAYVRRIMVNELSSLWRRPWRRRETTTDQVPEVAGAPPGPAGPNEALWRAVQTLPRKARAVLVLRYYEELTETETADVLGISVGTVKSQTSRALARLRETAPELREEER